MRLNNQENNTVQSTDRILEMETLKIWYEEHYGKHTQSFDLQCVGHKRD